MVHTPRVLFSDQLSGPRQRFDALCVLYRIRLWRLADAVAVVARSGRNQAEVAKSEVVP
jgi:hypothetical protein